MNANIFFIGQFWATSLLVNIMLVSYWPIFHVLIGHFFTFSNADILTVFPEVHGVLSSCMTSLVHRHSNPSKSGINLCPTTAEATLKSLLLATNVIWTATKKWIPNREKILRLNLVVIFMNPAQKVGFCRFYCYLTVIEDNLNIENVFMGLVRNILVNMPLERPPDAAGDRGSTATLNLESKPLPAGGSCPC